MEVGNAGGEAVVLGDYSTVLGGCTFRDMAELGHLVGTVGEYQVFQVVENDPEPSVVRYALLGPSPFMCATFESLKDAMEAAHRLARQLKS